MSFSFKITSLSAVAAVVLVACGGGGGGTSPTAATPAALAGTVIDGYIEGATVCLDLNGNQACDAGEPSATSKADGTYSLDISGLTTAQIKAAHLLTVVPTTAFDADDTVNGVKKTLAQAGKAAFSLMAPASAFIAADGTLSSAVISPLTTLVSHDMLVGNNKPLADAIIAVRTRMGLAANIDLTQDYVAKNDANLMQQARVVAAAIGEVKKSALAVTGTSDRDALLAALTYLQQNIAALEIAAAQTGTPAPVVNLVKAALLQTALIPTPATLITTAQQFTTTSAADTLAIFSDGFYIPTAFVTGISYISGYGKVSGLNGQWQNDQYNLSNGNWAPFTYTTSIGNFNLTANGWVAANNRNNGAITPDGLGGGTATSAGGYKFRFSFRSQDVSGKTAGSIAGLFSLMPLSVLPDALKNKVFADGSKVLWSQTAPLDDEYSINTSTSSNLFVTTCTSNNVCTNQNMSSIADLLGAYATGSFSSNKPPIFSNGVYVTFDDGGTSTGGTVTVWTDGVTQSTCTANSCVGTASSSVNPLTFTKTGTKSTYEIKTVYGQQVLIVKGESAFYSYNNLFAVKGGQLFSGTYTSAAAYPASTNATLYFNKAAFNSIMTAVGNPAVVN